MNIYRIASVACFVVAFVIAWYRVALTSMMNRAIRRTVRINRASVSVRIGSYRIVGTRVRPYVPLMIDARIAQRAVDDAYKRGRADGTRNAYINRRIETSR